MTNIRVFATWLKSAGERGATMVEYVLLVALVALVGAVGWNFVGNAISSTSENVCETIESASNQAGPNTGDDCEPSDDSE